MITLSTDAPDTIKNNKHDVMYIVFTTNAYFVIKSKNKKINLTTQYIYYF